MSLVLAQGAVAARATAAAESMANPCPADPSPPPGLRVLSAAQVRAIVADANGHHKTIDLSGANLNHVKLNDMTLKNAVFKRSFLVGADFRRAQLQYAHFEDAHAQHAIFDRANLLYTHYSHAALWNATFIGSDAYGVSFDQANLDCANLTGAYMNGASFKGDDRHRTDLTRTNLSNADLYDAHFDFANLNATNLAGTKLAHADLSDAVYDPRGDPPDANVAGLKGIATLQIPPEQEGGIIQLRKRMIDGDLRDEEREATYSIERTKTSELFGGTKFPLEAAIRVVAFDWTTSYGRYPAHALLLIFYVWAALIFVYAFAIVIARYRPNDAAGIYKVLPADRIDPQGAATGTGERKVIRVEQPLTPAGALRAVIFSAYCSLLNAFNIGFQNLDVGDWIRRVQPVEYAVQSVGWVRVVAGTQALLSLYLFAMWVLTFFGRPFQ